MTRPDRKLRILFITSDKYPPCRPAAKAIFSEELVRRGHKVDWIIQAEKSCQRFHHEEFGNGTAYIGATDDGGSKWHRLRKHLLDIANDLRMFWLIKPGSYDLVQVKDKYLAAILALMIARLRGVKYFYWLAYPHAEASLYSARMSYARYRWVTYMKGILYHFCLYKVILRFADHAFVQSEQMKRDIISEGVPAHKLTPIPGSLNLDQIACKPPSDDNAEAMLSESKKIVYLGTLISVRRLDFLIRVIAEVIKKYPGAKLYLVGKGEQPRDEQLLQSEIDRLNVRHAVVMTGQLPIEAALSHVAEADVCLSPYYPIPILNSTSPTKLIEYMAMGKAVVGNDHPEQSLVINESGAGYCSPWSEAEFSAAIIRILDNPSLAREMGQKARVRRKVPDKFPDGGYC
ncbi:MAG: glycosyltransferase family 4 protein [Gammaproteobacteria bacterium]|nr:glycosyltransferase family 4 protein [Gammaproteobacteria bacterium]